MPFASLSALAAALLAWYSSSSALTKESVAPPPEGDGLVALLFVLTVGLLAGAVALGAGLLG